MGVVPWAAAGLARLAPLPLVVKLGDNLCFVERHHRQAERLDDHWLWPLPRRMWNLQPVVDEGCIGAIWVVELDIKVESFSGSLVSDTAHGMLVNLGSLEDMNSCVVLGKGLWYFMFLKSGNTHDPCHEIAHT